MKATVNQETCTGCELCVSTCPEVFEMSDNGTAVAKVDEVPAGAESSAQEAADDCPVEAIAIQ
jgi:ferredoxin